MKKQFWKSVGCLLLMTTVLTACQSEQEAPSESTDPVDTTTEPTVTTESCETTTLAVEPQPMQDFVVAKRGEESPFVIVIHDSALTDWSNALAEQIEQRIGVRLSTVEDSTPVSDHEIVLGSETREAFLLAERALRSDEYIIRASVTEDGKQQICLLADTELARLCAYEHLMAAFATEEGVTVPADCLIRNICSYDTMTIMPEEISALRDPCVLVANGVYYVYGTGWKAYKNDTGDLRAGWQSLGTVVQFPADYRDCPWAPEVHAYNGAYYMFTTYRSHLTGHRGCTILKADTPEGPFVQIGDGHLTPSGWDAIDGTLYIDQEGQPWMVFVHEWTSTSDGIGRMAAARLSEDLTHFVSQPVELFRADDPAGYSNQVTDGCWLYTSEEGELFMLWSNGDESGYCVRLAKSDNGQIDGTCSHLEERLYTKGLFGVYDGGHGMLFTALDGRLYLAIHSPNQATTYRSERPIFLPVCEKNGVLTLDLGYLYADDLS
ncbi:MAG: family 43 glycosylhydrolase [Clostridia bacterium]|nr:family 43 glycosylhydrolase [Clostridia bacterium]